LRSNGRIDRLGFAEHSSRRFARFFMAVAACTALTVAIASAAPAHASAQMCTGAACTAVHPDGKGIIGLAVIGAEIGLIVPAIVQNAANTHEWWPYLVFPLIGIGAGIGGGYALEQATQTSPEVDVGIMIGSFVLIIPAIVGTLALSTYTPPSETAPSDDDMTYDDTSSSGDSVEAVQDGGSAAPDTSSSSGSSDSTTTPSSTSPATTTTGPTSQVAPTLIGGPGLVRMDADTHQIVVGVPLVGAIARYTSEELASLHMQQQYDVNIPLVSATF
jgi:hypothetical protein